MSYFRRARPGLSGVQSQPAGGRISNAALGGVQSQPAGGRIARSALGSVGGAGGGPRWYRQLQGTTLGADDAPGNTLADPTLSEPQGDVVKRIDKNVTQLVEASDREERFRKIGLIFAAVGTVFAAAKLGIIAIPHIRKYRSGEET